MASRIQNKIRDYEEFLETRLEPDLREAIEDRDQHVQRAQDCQKLVQTLTLIRDRKNPEKPLTTMVNLGSEIYCKAQVPDTSMVLVDVGLGFHVQFTLEEAIEFLPKKESVHERNVQAVTSKISNIKSHIKLVGEGIRELTMSLQQQ